MEDRLICRCKNVSYSDVERAMKTSRTFTQVLDTFKEIQRITHCSTGCGGCHDEIMDAISEIMDK